MDAKQLESWTATSMSDLLRSAQNHWKSVVATAVVVAGAGVCAALLLPSKFRSDGLVYVRLGRGALAADPMTNPNRSVSLQESRTTEVFSVGEMIESRELAERAVRRVGAERINTPRTWLAKTLDSLGRSLSPKPDVPVELDLVSYEKQVELEESVETLQDAISVKVPKNGYTVGVSAAIDDPVLAQSMVQAILDEYKAFHVEAHQASGTLEFLLRQVQESKALATEARQALQQARSKAGWLSLETAEATLRERIVKASTSLDQAEAESKEAQLRADDLAAQLEGIDQWVPIEVTSGIADNAGDIMRSQLYDLQVKESEAISKLSPSHPRYRMLQEQLSKSASIVEQESSDRSQTREALNPVHQAISTAAQTARSEAAGLTGRRDALRKALQAAKADAERLNQDAVELTRLAWQADIAEKNYLTHSQRLEEARMTAELDRAEFSDVSVIQDASLNLKPIGPSKAIIVLLSAAMGVFLGLLQAFLRSPLPANKAHSLHRLQPMAAGDVLASGSGVGISDAAIHGPATASGAAPTSIPGTKASPMPLRDETTLPEYAPTIPR
ncbi:MAG: GNVR domain-containing protein [Planctomycetota bacterium]